MVVIGHVTMPSEWVVTRASEDESGRPATVELDSYHDKVYFTGYDLPTIRYVGICQTTNREAINILDSLVEQFTNPEINYPMYINVDEKFYFLLESFSYNLNPGVVNTWRFRLNVRWVGTPPIIKEVYILETFTKEDNDWDI